MRTPYLSDTEAIFWPFEHWGVKGTGTMFVRNNPAKNEAITKMNELKFPRS